MVHPFSAVPTPYRVGTPIGAHFDLTMTRGRAGPQGAVVRLAVPVRDFWDDIGFT